MAVGIGLVFWPLVISHGPDTKLMTGVAWSLLAVMGLLAAVGVRHPLRMLPVLLLELGWKTLWLLVFALPRWLDGSVDPAMRQTTIESALAAILLVAIPWRYVWAVYVTGVSEVGLGDAKRDQFLG